MSFLIYNTTVFPINELPYDPLNRAFYYGDGFFESILVVDNEIKFLDDHYDRINKALDAFCLETPNFFTKNYIKESINILSGKSEISGNYRIKAVFWRKGAGLYTPHTNETEIIFTISTFKPTITSKNKCFFYDKIKTSFSIISSFKTLSSAIYTLSSIEKLKRNADEMIILDTNLYVSECTNSNLFFINNNVLYTPSVECGCIDGIMRKQIIKFCKKNGIEIREGKYSKEFLLRANFVFTSNTSGLIPISSIDEVIFDHHSSIFENLLTIK